MLVLGVTQLLNLLFRPLFAHAGLTLAISVGALINALLLLVGLIRRKSYVPLPGWGLFSAAGAGQHRAAGGVPDVGGRQPALAGPGLVGPVPHRPAGPGDAGGGACCISRCWRLAGLKLRQLLRR
jgi:hypothetical protein